MSDLISRRAAISLPVKPKEDRYFQTQNLDDAYDYGWYDLQECIEKMPPAQPDLQPTCNKLATDTIIRQEAIDALDGEIEITGRTNAEAVKGYVRLVKDRLERLPSAQPEIIRCGECKYMMEDGRCWEFADDAIRPSVSDFCSHAERREDD